MEAFFGFQDLEAPVKSKMKTLLTVYIGKIGDQNDKQVKVNGI